MLKLDKNDTTTASEIPTMQNNPADKGKFSTRIITKATVQTQTPPPKKQKLQRSPICPPTSKIDNLRKNQISKPKPNNKAEHSPQSKRDHLQHHLHRSF